jgi:tetratricopeptide (TPR) repeat protein
MLIVAVLVGCNSNRVSRATELKDVGSYEEGIKLLQEEISNNPKNGQAYFVYGQILIKKEDHDGAYDKFRCAIKCSIIIKGEITEFLQRKENNTFSDLNFINEIDPNRVSTDPDFCYRYYAGYPDSGLDCSKFADYFPLDKRASKVILTKAEHCYFTDRDSAKELYYRLVEKYPSTKEGSEAKERLANWWNEYTIQLPMDCKWRGRPIQKGQSYKYSIDGNIVIRTPFGDQEIGSGDIRIFIGTPDELTEFMKHRFDWNGSYNGPKDFTPGSMSGNGIAERRGSIWFVINSQGVKYLDRSLTVHLELKG